MWRQGGSGEEAVLDDGRRIAWGAVKGDGGSEGGQVWMMEKRKWEGQ